ncbi:MAG: glycosyltransferase family 39 protein [Pirellulales bacterium]|nr:glycosyltransferase family 39 protein [Pirellulales bacterium]
MLSSRRLPTTLWLILLVALALRLLGAWHANLTFDERARVALAETIDLRPGHLHLVSRTVAHPPMSIYLMKLSGLAFGTGDLGLRMLHVVAGTLTVLLVFFLGRRVFSERAGLWAAALLAVDQFHAGWSRVVLTEVLMLLFASLVLLQFLRVLESGTTRRFAVLGLLLGLAYLAKEVAILLLPVLWIYLLITPRHRRVLRRPTWYLAQGVFLAAVAPDVIWNLVQGMESYLYRDLMFASEPFHISLKSLSLYVGELFRAWFGDPALDVEYEQGSLYTCYWPAGVLYLGAVTTAVVRRKDPAVRLLLVMFTVIFGAFFLLPGGDRFEPFWWASMSLIPAVVCAGWALDWAARSGRMPALAALLLIGLLGAHYVPVALRSGEAQPRATVRQFVDDFLRRADAALRRGNLREAESRYVFMLNLGGPNAEAFYGLATVAAMRGQTEKAELLLQKCLELDPDHEAASERLRQLRARPKGPDSRPLSPQAGPSENVPTQQTQREPTL